MRISDWSSDVCSPDLACADSATSTAAPAVPTRRARDGPDWRAAVNCSDHAHVRDADVLVAAVLLVVRDTDMWISKETRAVRLGGRACRSTTIEAMHRVPPLRCCVPVSQARGKVCDGHRPQIFPRPRAHGAGPVFLLAVPHHEQVRHALPRLLATLLGSE